MNEEIFAPPFPDSYHVQVHLTSFCSSLLVFWLLTVAFFVLFRCTAYMWILQLNYIAMNSVCPHPMRWALVQTKRHGVVASSSIGRSVCWFSCVFVSFWCARCRACKCAHNWNNVFGRARARQPAHVSIVCVVFCFFFLVSSCTMMYIEIEPQFELHWRSNRKSESNLVCASNAPQSIVFVTCTSLINCILEYFSLSMALAFSICNSTAQDNMCIRQLQRIAISREKKCGFLRCLCVKWSGQRLRRLMTDDQIYTYLILNE